MGWWDHLIVSTLPWVDSRLPAPWRLNSYVLFESDRNSLPSWQGLFGATFDGTYLYESIHGNNTSDTSQYRFLRINPATAAVEDLGQYYSAGGWTSPATWWPPPPNPAQVNSAGCCFHQGKLYIFAGQDTYHPTSGPSIRILRVLKTRIYDPDTDMWTFSTSDVPGANVADPREFSTAVSVGDKIHLIGGWDNASHSYPTGQAYDRHDVYDPATDTWEVLPRISSFTGNKPRSINGNWPTSCYVPETDEIHVFADAWDYNEQPVEYSGGTWYQAQAHYVYDCVAETWSQRNVPLFLPGDKRDVTYESDMLFGDEGIDEAARIWDAQVVSPVWDEGTGVIWTMTQYSMASNHEVGATYDPITRRWRVSDDLPVFVLMPLAGYQNSYMSYLGIGHYGLTGGNPFHYGWFDWLTIREYPSGLLSTVATLDHDLLSGVGPDDHHDEVHTFLPGTTHTGGLFHKSGVSPTITDGDFLAPVNGMVATTFDTATAKSFIWMRSEGTWKSVEA